MLKVDKNIMIERQRQKHSFSGKARLAASEMVEGDSVRVKNISEREALRLAIKELHGPASVVTRKEHTGGYRVWRVAPLERVIIAHKRAVSVA